EPGSYQLLPDSVHIRVQPTIADKYLFPQDWLLVRMLVENRWRRPFYFTYPPPWLLQYARPEGLVSQLVPNDSANLDTSILRENLLTKYSYRGYADSSVPIDKFSQFAGQELFSAFLSLAQSELMQENPSACEQIKLELVKRLPLERIHPSEELLKWYENLCDSTRVGLKK
ncbi:hypothetical protein MUP77_24460, partial [Candidatus Bathyarchaeota archaeon]|nr:hypothetical protein [Candidatus Bathyarchaeota archaeon]